MKLFYSLKRKVLAVCLAGMILMALCVGGISLWTISHLTYDYEIQNMNHLVDTKATIITRGLAETVRSEWVIRVVGEVKARAPGTVDAKQPTGTVEVSLGVTRWKPLSCGRSETASNR